MHPVTTMKSWSHHLHDGILTLSHHIDEHLRSRHFWVGVMVTVLVTCFLALIYFLMRNAPFAYPQDYPYLPYGV